MKKRTLMLVQPSEILEPMSEILESEGYEVVRAHHGQEALQKLEALEHLPDLMILELMLPVMNGRELVQALHQRAIRIPVFIYSAFSGLTVTERRELDVLRILPRPFELDEFLRMVAGAVKDRPLQPMPPPEEMLPPTPPPPKRSWWRRWISP